MGDFDRGIREMYRPKEQKYTLDEIMNALKDISIINPYHIQLISNGFGQFPDGYKFTDIGIEKLKKEIKDKLSV